MVLTDGELLVAEESPRAVTIAHQIRTMSLLRPDKVAMREKDFGIWQEYTWEKTWDLVHTAAHGLLEIGRAHV